MCPVVPDPNSKADLTLSMSETGAGCTLEGVEGTPSMDLFLFRPGVRGHALTAACFCSNRLDAGRMDAACPPCAHSACGWNIWKAEAEA